MADNFLALTEKTTSFPELWLVRCGLRLELKENTAACDEWCSESSRDGCALYITTPRTAVRSFFGSDK
jgi:hypothetical protein